MLTGIPPAFFFIAGAFFVPFLKGRAKSVFMLAIPVLAFLTIANIPEGQHWTYSLLHYDLVLGHIDRLSKVFGYIFTIIAFIGVLYSIDIADDVQYVSGLVYAGSALGVTFAGDLFTLYIFWEIMAVASTFLILARKTESSQAAGMRYILVHIVGGLFLLAGIVIHVSKTGDMAVSLFTLSSLESALIFIGVAVNAAIPPLHPWLKDAYPEATVPGAVFLSAFTTKSAVYVMARMFAGTELLIWLGAMMTAFPIFYAVLENDIRRVLSYSLVNQVGFMLCGVGIGTQLAINGTASHAFCHILYKALLFMSTGSVLYMTGKIRCTDLGGLYKTMPLTCLFCIVGAASISAFPLFSGFVSKSMIISSAGHNHLAAVWLILQFASVGVIDHAGIKVPFFTFFSEDSGIRTTEPPKNMLAAMGIAAFLCVFIGVYPKPLYDILPYPVHYAPYTAAHVVGQLQLLMFGILAFCLLMFSGKYPAEIRAINIDFDWFYRIGGKYFYRIADDILNGVNYLADLVFVRKLPPFVSQKVQNAPPRTASRFLVLFQRFKGASKEDREMFRKKVYESLDSGTIPVGVGAAFAAVFIVLIFFLS